jgi:hypothetical protein
MLAGNREASVEAPPLRIVNAQQRFPRVDLIAPSTSRFVHIAAEIDRRPALLPASRAKKRVLSHCKDACARLGREPGVLNAVVFTALLVPPGLGEYAKQHADRLHIAHFDLAVLFECENAEAVQRLQQHPAYREMERAIAAAASYVHTITATNVRRIGAVDHSRQGVFLFNHFAADSLAQNLAVWDYTAGWFEVETGLDNSTVLLPADPGKSQYSIINHCRWDRLRDILPSLLFKRSFHSYVLDNFAANNVAAMPILYRLA